MTSTEPAAPAETPPPAVAVMQMLSGFQISQALYVLVKLDVPTVLADGPSTVAALADRAGARPDVLRRLIRTLAPLGLFHRRDNDVVELTPTGAVLSRSHPDSLCHVATYFMETHYLPFSELLHTARTGENAAQHYLGQPFFDWIVERPDLVEVQNRAMASALRGSIYADYRLPDGKVVADIGGADGTALAALLSAAPDRLGILFDLPQVVAEAPDVLAEAGLSDRVEIVPGDFFVKVPTADVYVLSTVLHDWDDELSARILGSVARAAAPGARLVLAEMVVPDGDEPHLAKLVDLTMLAMLTGKERSLDEWAALLAGSGFALDRVVPSASPFSFIEATRLG